MIFHSYYPVVNEHITKISILDGAKNSKQKSLKNTIHLTTLEVGDFLLSMVKMITISILVSYPVFFKRKF